MAIQWQGWEAYRLGITARSTVFRGVILGGQLTRVHSPHFTFTEEIITFPHQELCCLSPRRQHTAWSHLEDRRMIQHLVKAGRRDYACFY